MPTAHHATGAHRQNFTPAPARPSIRNRRLGRAAALVLAVATAWLLALELTAPSVKAASAANCAGPTLPALGVVSR